MQDRIKAVKKDIETDIQQMQDGSAAEQIRIKYLGRKGLVTGLFKDLGTLDPGERPVVGKQLNQLRELVEKAVRDRQDGKTARKGEWVDLTLPGRKPPRGRLHPINQARRSIKEIFGRMGFSVADGPEVESDYLNFEALNIPKLHPARDMQDTLYISDDLVLRTHTSPVQIRTMQAQKPPIRIIALGRVYRRDTPDASHLAAFHQVEGLCIDKHISLGDLKAILSVFARSFFGKDLKVHSRPSFFPFTEPSAEMDIWWESGKGGGRWLELLGCGMVHPNVLRNVDIDPAEYSGWAFGMGVDRAAVLKFGVQDIRHLLENDMRFLEQF